MRDDDGSEGSLNLGDGRYVSRTQSISGTGTPRMGEADAIGSPIIQESKAEGRRRHWFTGGFICPLRVTCRLRAVRKPSANGP